MTKEPSNRLTRIEKFTNSIASLLFCLNSYFSPINPVETIYKPAASNKSPQPHYQWGCQGDYYCDPNTLTCYPATHCQYLNDPNNLLAPKLGELGDFGHLAPTPPTYPQFNNLQDNYTPGYSPGYENISPGQNYPSQNQRRSEINQIDQSLAQIYLACPFIFGILFLVFRLILKNEQS